VPLVYIYPATLHLKGVAESRADKIYDIALITLGVATMGYTTVLTLKQWAEGSL
jgi:proton-coupled amino acid transporter